METQVDELIGKITEFLKSEAKTDTIIGSPFTLGEYTCVPVMSVGMGFGAGTGEGKGDAPKQGKGEGHGAGGAAGMGIGPVGFLASRGADIQFIPASTAKGFSAAIEKIPGLVDKFMDMKAAKAN